MLFLSLARVNVFSDTSRAAMGCGADMELCRRSEKFPFAKPVQPFMSYDTLYFAMFLAGVWLAFAITPWHGWVLLAASIVFYSVAGLRDSLLAAYLIAVNYGFQFPILKNRR